MKLSDYLSHIKRIQEFREVLVYHRYIAPRRPDYGPDQVFCDDISSAIGRLGIGKLFSHQVEALEAIRHGRNVVVSTPTASGKSLIYNIAVIERILRENDARAIYIFPLKALEQDQLKNLSGWLGQITGTRIRAEIYDGDTTPYKRKKIRTDPPHIIFTNPDMLHRGILPYHESWEAMLRHLSFVIIDEVHTYRGIFGSHLNQVIRRLKRVCRHYRAHPRFILLSATINNPREFGEALIEEEVSVIDSDGSPSAGRHFLLMNPDTSPGFYAARLFLDCIRKGFKTIAFTQSRKITELIHVWISQMAPDISKKVSSYRAGFMPEERREIERRLASGDLLGVVSTSALEMGIDIGYLDICLLVGYPGTIINTWQRSGRVGRSGRESMVILIAQPDALDQYFMKHPNDLFERSFEAAILDPNNPYVVRAHLPCAAAEIPITLKDEKYWPCDLTSHLEALERAGDLTRSAEGEPAWFAIRKNPHLKVNIRSSGNTFTIFEKKTGQAIGTIDGIRAFKECHPGAIYLHRASQYMVDRLMVEKKDIIVSNTGLKYFTRPRVEKETEIIQVHRSRPQGQFLARDGELKVTEVVSGYEKRAMPGQELMGVYPLDLPSQTFETTGLWVEIEPELKNYVEENGLHFMGGIHAIEHAAIGMFPLFVLCDRNDIGGICYPYHPQVKKSAIFIYDAYPGGVGLAKHGFDVILKLLERTRDHIRDCECEDGCPSCIHSPKCGSGNKPLDKKAALLILGGLLGDVSLGDISQQGDEIDVEDVSVKEDLAGRQKARPNILFFDLETQKTAQDVGGWHNSHLMRVSVAVLFDTTGKEFRAFDEESIELLIGHLEKADLVVGFNIKRFDYKVLSAYTNKDLQEFPTFDILEDIHRRLGFRLGLDHLAKETLGRGKTAHGLKAVEWFRQGETKKLTEYCREDVAVTRDLFQYGLENGYLIYREKRTGTRVRLPVDWKLDDLLTGPSV